MLWVARAVVVSGVRRAEGDEVAAAAAAGEEDEGGGVCGDGWAGRVSD